MAANSQSRPTTMWFDHRLVLHDSPIHGIGTFALEPIAAGEPLIAVTGGLVFSQADLAAGRFPISGALYNQSVLTDDLRIVTPAAFNYYLNHSCAPNATDLSRHPANTHYVALRDVAAGEEVTADYYTTDTLDHCRCGANTCRWQSPGAGTTPTASLRPALGKAEGDTVAVEITARR